MDTPKTAPRTVLDLVSEQAEDDGLWFVAQTAPEAYLQLALRRLHAATEAEAEAEAAQPAGLDVERLARALNATVGKHGWARSTPASPVEEWMVNAERIAAEYARLAAPQVITGHANPDGSGRGNWTGE